MNTVPAYYDSALIFRFDLNPPQALLLRTADGFALPGFTYPPHFWQTCAPVHQALRDQYRLETAILRCLETRYDEGAAPAYQRLYAAEWLAGDMPENGSFVPLDALASLKIDTPFDLPSMARRCVDDHPLRPAWAKPGWTAQLLAALPERLRAAGYHLNAPFNHLRAWERGTVLELPTDRGRLYLKASPDFFAHEAPLAAWLAQHFPTHTPQTLDLPDTFIMTAYSGTGLNNHPDVAIYEAALQVYARLQIGTTDHVDELRALGVPERSIDWLEAAINALFEDETALTCGHSPLSAAEIDRLRAMLPAIQASCQALRDAPIPVALEHGDLWSGQIIVNDGQLIVSDWSDSTLTFPLFSLPFFTAELAGDLPDVPDAKARMEQAYLNEWTRFAPIETQRALLPHVERLSPLFTAVRYYRDILPGMEQPWEMENMLAYNLRLLLRD